jgi:copper transport protein
VRPRRVARCLALGLALAYGLVAGQSAGAHALLWQSSPDSGAVLRAAPRAVVLTFTEPPDAALSAVQVLDSTGHVVRGGPAQRVAGQPLALQVPLGALPRGVYTVAWRTVSATDGHVAGGMFSFGIGEPPASAVPQTTSPPPSSLYVVSRFLLYAGLSGLLGMALASASLVHWFPMGTPVLLWALWITTAVGVGLLGMAQAADAGVGIVRLLHTTVGQALWWRAMPVGVAGVAAAVWQWGTRHRRGAMVALGLLAGITMLAQVASGHAAAGTGAGRWLAILEQSVHFAAIGAWLGALLGLLVVAPGMLDDGHAARWCSVGAAAALGAVAVTGVLRAADEVGSWDALRSTGFGMLVLVKAGLFMIIAGLGAVARHAAMAGAPSAARRLRRVVGAELLFTAGALAVTAWLTGLPLPGGAATPSAAAGSISTSGADYATSVRVRLTVTPGTPGVNRFLAEITDYDAGRPVAADRVTLRFAVPDRTDLGTSSLVLRRTLPGTYEGQGANISLEGRWSVTVAIERGIRSVEVPLQLTAARRPDGAGVVRAPGQPPLHTVGLPGRRMLDVYLDPGHAGPNEVHGTFLDAGGRELELARAPTITAAGPRGRRIALPVVQEGRGHFYADGDFQPGDWDLEIVATTQSGEALRVRLAVHLAAAPRIRSGGR